MDQREELRARLAKEEKITVQLANENDSIGEYIVLYQQQREVSASSCALQSSGCGTPLFLQAASTHAHVPFSGPMSTQALNRKEKEKDEYIDQLRYTVSVLQDKLGTITSEPRQGVEVVQPAERKAVQPAERTATTAAQAPPTASYQRVQSVPAWVYQTTGGRHNSSPVVSL